MTNDQEEKVKHLLKSVVDHFDQEDRAARDRQIRKWKQLKYFWDGIQRVWFDEVAHDWRVYEPSQYTDDTGQGYYDKNINVFRAYLESVIAALSVTVPGIHCYPDDADNSLDLSTAKAGDKIAQLIYRHNNAPLLWLHALFVYSTEGLICAYNYTDSNKKYGIYDKKEYEEVNQFQVAQLCEICGTVIEESTVDADKYNPGPEDVDPFELCPQCQQLTGFKTETTPLTVTRLVGVTKEAKTRQCIEVYGGLNVKVPLYARCQSDCPYLFFYYEDNYANIIEKYPDLHEFLVSSDKGKTGGAYNQYEEWGRLSPQYRGEMPINTRTVRNCWLRPAAFNILPEEDTKFLKDFYPDGCRVVFINEEFAEAENQSLDDHWTLVYNPLSDYVQFDPLGMLLTSVQDITSDLISLTLQTVEHGVGQTFVDPSVLDMDAYSQTEVLPGGIFPATAKSGRNLGDSFFQIKTATLSQEVGPFGDKIQTLGQLASGALPSLFGGSLNESNTASEYSMSRAQALQRLQNTWKMLTAWWKEIFGKVIPAYIETVVEDERTVEKDQFGGFINTFIKKAELEGKIGRVELEANENLPITWNQKKDVIMQLLQSGNPEILAQLGAPENLPLIREAIGLTEFYVPGEDDRAKQNEEIQLLINSQPQMIPPSVDPAMLQNPQVLMQLQQNPQMAQQLQQQMQPQEVPSVSVDPLVDNHMIHIEICRAWAVSEAGRFNKSQNIEGYKNVLLHLQQHMMFMQQQMMAQPQQGAQGNEPKESTSAPIQEESDINAEQ